MRLSDEALRRDLHVFQNQGHCLWDGVAEINLRGALPKEADTWQAGLAHPGSDSRGLASFLLPVVDPSRLTMTTMTIETMATEAQALTTGRSWP